MLCISLEEATDPERAGGKAVGLRNVHALGLRVPRTVVVTCDALRRFVAHHQLEPELAAYHRELAAESTVRADDRYRQLAARVRAAALPDDLRGEVAGALPALGARGGFAVRSSARYEDSAGASFAGVFASYLGARDVDAVLRCLVDCWLSAWSPRALRYLDRMGVEPAIDSMAVMIQPVVPAAAAGVIVTANPRSGNPWQFEVHATRGLAADLMSGSGAGDEYLLDWESGQVLAQTLSGEVAVLSTREIAAVAAAARRVDEANRRRMDVEWAFADDLLWVVQARPLTAIPRFRTSDLDRAAATRPSGAPSAGWELAPFVIPLRSLELLGLRHVGDHPRGLLTPLYADLSEAELWYRYQPDGFALTSIWREELDVHGHRYVDSGPRPTFLDHFGSPAEMERWFEQHEPPYRARWERRHDELAAIVGAAQAALRETRDARSLIPAVLAVRDRVWDLNAFGWSGPQALGWMCEALLAHFLGGVDPTLRVASLIGGEDSYSLALAAALQELGRSIRDQEVRAVVERAALDEVVPRLARTLPDCDFLRRYEELCWRFGKTPPSWRARPPFWRSFWDAGDAGAVHAIRSAMRGEGRDARAVQRRARLDRDREEARVRALVAAKRPGEVARFQRLLESTRIWTQALNDRHAMAVGVLWERELIWQLGNRLVSQRSIPDAADVLLLRAEDLRRYAAEVDATELSRTYDLRAREYRRNRRLEPPLRLGADGDDAAQPLGATPPAAAPAGPGDVLTGVGFGRGSATGRARLVKTLNAGLLDSLDREDVLVLLDENAFAYADWHSLLMTVKGVVSVARPAHHLTQVAREIGVPVVGHVRSGVEGLREGARVHLDAERGTVRLE